MVKIQKLALIAVMSILTSCGFGTADRANPLLEEWDTPFGIAPFDRIRPTDYPEAFDLAFEELERDISKIVSRESQPTFANVIVALDRSGVRLRELKDLFEMSEAAMVSDYSEVSEKLMPRISAAEDAVWMNEQLFERVKSIYDRRAELNLDALDRRLVERMYTKFVRGGALLNSEDKATLADINSREATLCATFTHNLVAENDSFILNLNSRQLDGLHINLRYAAREEATRRGLKDRWVFTLSPNSMIPFLMNSEERDLREAIYKAYINRGANGGEYDNQDIVREVTKLRQERAALLGYENHADYVISQQMAGSVDSVYMLLDRVWEAAKYHVEVERATLERRLVRDKKDAEFEAWDWWYYAEKERSSNYSLSDDQLRPFFTVDNVRQGAFLLANRLYGLAFRPIVVPQYDPRCVAFEVLDRDASHLGVIYFDLFARTGKSQGAWCGNLRAQRYEGDRRIDPIVGVVCNFSLPTKGLPAMLSLEQVETLFHEFGHALHFIFQDVEYRALADVEGDFVEFPSQVMENWALEPELLKDYAFHYHSKAPISEKMVANIVKSKRSGRGAEILSYTAAALLDLELQQLPAEECDSLDIAQFESRVLNKERGLIEQLAPKYRLTNFSHLFTYDYSAGYYFYLWAEVLDQDCFEVFKRSGNIFSKPIADKLRHEVLEQGSTSDGMTLYRNFKGGKPSVDPMLRSKGLLE